MSQTFVSAVAAGRSLPSLQFAAGLRQAFGVSLDWYLWGQGEPFAAVALGRSGGSRPPDDEWHGLVDEARAEATPRQIAALRAQLELLAGRDGGAARAKSA